MQLSVKQNLNLSKRDLVKMNKFYYFCKVNKIIIQ